MDYKYIEQLIDRYFEGETSIAEERILKAFFSQNDVPAHLQQFADVFAYEEAEAKSEALGDDFDQRVLERLALEGEAPEVHVKIQRLTFTDRIRPLFRAAAAVAIVVLVGGSMHRAYVTHTIDPISQFGTDEEQAEGEEMNNAIEEESPNLFIQQGKRVAISLDTLGITSKAE